MFWKCHGRLSNYLAVSDTELGLSFIAAYNMADASISKRIWKDRLALTAGCKDLFNVRNVNAAVSGGAHTGGSTSVPMTTGRTAFIRIELDLKQSAK